MTGSSVLNTSLPAAAGPTLQGEDDWTYNRWLGRWRNRSAQPGAGERRSGSASRAIRAVAEPVEAMPFDDSDRSLVERVKAGDVRAFEMLHRRYHARIYRFAFLRLGNAEDAADVASNTFVKALNRLDSFQFRRSPSIYPWLHQIASNCVVDAIRNRPPGGMLSLDAQAAEDVDSFLEYLPADGPTPQELVERDEVRQIVLRAIDQLPGDQARAVALRFLDDLSIREIAQALERSEGAVKSLLHRALQGLRNHLKTTVANTRATVTTPPVQRHGKAESHVPEVVHLHPRDS